MSRGSGGEGGSGFSSNAFSSRSGAVPVPAASSAPSFSFNVPSSSFPSSFTSSTPSTFSSASNEPSPPAFPPHFPNSTTGPSSSSSASVDALVDRFPTAFTSGALSPQEPPRCTLERYLILMSGMLRGGEQWRVGLRDPTTRGSWREELLTADLDPPLLSSHVDYLLAELDWYAATREPDTAIERSTADGVWQSDSLLPLTCLSSLQKHVGALMESQAEARGGQSVALPQVRELVDPSLYPLTAGRTVVVADEQVSLERSLDMQGAGQVLTMKEFRRRAVAIPSDPERFAEEQKKQRAASQSLGPAQRAKEAKAEGKMLLQLQLAVKEVRGGPTVSRAGLCTVFVLPTSTIAEVKRLAQMTEEWKEGWQVGDVTLPPRTVYLSTMYSDQQHALRDHRTLQSYDIHSNDPQHTTMLTLEALAVPQPPAARPAQFVYIELYSVSGALLCAVRADESETIAAIKQRLSAGDVEGKYPVTTGLPISEFRLLTMSSQHASRVHHLLGEERRLSEYGWYNVDHPKRPRKYSYGAHRVTVHPPARRRHPGRCAREGRAGDSRGPSRASRHTAQLPHCHVPRSPSSAVRHLHTC